MRNLLFTMSYDGTAYHGFQIQKNKATIEGELNKAFFELTGENLKIAGCGRTDAGVHGLKYFFSVRTASAIPCRNFPTALNTKLPDDIVVFSCEEKDRDFHARFSAVSKTYLYKIYTGKFLNPFMRNYSYHYTFPLDLERMREAAKYIEGTHDFACFMASGSVITNTVRTVYGIEIKMDNNMLNIEVCGNGFLYNMVRIIVGTLLAVGNGKTEPSHIKTIINSKKRENAGMTVPPQGLYLKEVYYGK